MPEHVRRDTLALPNGDSSTYTYVDHPGSVFVVPITPNGKVVLIRSYRYTIDEWVWEIHAGTLADKDEDAIEAAAKAELAEEIGAACERLEKLGNFYISNGFARMQAHYFMAVNVLTSGTKRHESFEVIDKVAVFGIEEVKRMIYSGEMRDADSAFGILLATGRMP